MLRQHLLNSHEGAGHDPLATRKASPPVPGGAVRGAGQGRDVTGAKQLAEKEREGRRPRPISPELSPPPRIFKKQASEVSHNAEQQFEGDEYDEPASGKVNSSSSENGDDGEVVINHFLKLPACPRRVCGNTAIHSRILNRKDDVFEILCGGRIANKGKGCTEKLPADCVKMIDDYRGTSVEKEIDKTLWAIDTSHKVKPKTAPWYITRVWYCTAEPNLKDKCPARIVQFFRYGEDTTATCVMANLTRETWQGDHTHGAATSKKEAGKVRGKIVEAYHEGQTVLQAMVNITAEAPEGSVHPTMDTIRGVFRRERKETETQPRTEKDIVQALSELSGTSAHLLSLC